MLPIVINEHQGALFNFYFQGEIRQGMRYMNALYGLAHIVQAGYRDAAYDIACQLAASGTSVVITVAKEQYKIWTNLSQLGQLGQPCSAPVQAEISTRAVPNVLS